MNCKCALVQSLWICSDHRSQMCGLQDHVSCAFIVRVTNAEERMQAYAARAALRHLSTSAAAIHGAESRTSSHAVNGSGGDANRGTADAAAAAAAQPRMLCTCVWLLGEFGDLLDAHGLQNTELEEGEEAWEPPGGAAECALACVTTLLAPEQPTEVCVALSRLHVRHIWAIANDLLPSLAVAGSFHVRMIKGGSVGVGDISVPWDVLA
jgi:hypothetical protein